MTFFQPCKFSRVARNILQCELIGDILCDRLDQMDLQESGLVRLFKTASKQLKSSEMPGRLMILDFCFALSMERKKYVNISTCGLERTDKVVHLLIESFVL